MGEETKEETQTTVQPFDCSLAECGGCTYGDCMYGDDAEDEEPEPDK